MRTLMATLFLTLATALPLQAAEGVEGVECTQSAAVANADRIEFGDGVGMPRAVFEQLVARDDGVDLIDRMQHRAADAKSFDGVPHLVVIFIGVLLFFWSAMLYYQRKHARLHRTIQHMVEKGVPIPGEILRAVEHFESNGDGASNARTPIAAVMPPVWASNILWGGLLWLTIGLAGTLYLYMRGSDAWPWGFAAIVYGLGAVLTAVAKQRGSQADKA